MICPITQEEIIKAYALPCGHVFEEEEINKWLANNDNCPICRRNVKENSYEEVSCNNRDITKDSNKIKYRLERPDIPYRNAVIRLLGMPLGPERDDLQERTRHMRLERRLSRL